MSSEALRAAREAAEGRSPSEALAALKRARSECFRARDVDGLRHVLALDVGLRGRAPATLEALIAAVEQNIRVLGPPPADPRPAVESRGSSTLSPRPGTTGTRPGTIVSPARSSFTSEP